MVVLMLKGETHAREKVLKGFCSLRHFVLLAEGEKDSLLGENPIFKSFVANAFKESSVDGEDARWAAVLNQERKVRSFARCPRLRPKTQCPMPGL
jgi:hypothetical protein